MRILLIAISYLVRLTFLHEEPNGVFRLSQFLALPFKRESRPCQRIEPREDEEGARESMCEI
jgi:hypothetical protein